MTDVLLGASDEGDAGQSGAQSADRDSSPLLLMSDNYMAVLARALERLNASSGPERVAWRPGKPHQAR
jgi:hypothetical protein